MTSLQEAQERYFRARWSLFEIEVLAHHFCSRSPFARSQAPGYPVVIDRLREEGFMEPRSHQVTALGVEFIAKLCETEPPMAVAHASDCAVHNAPALEPGPCDCGALKSKGTEG